MAVLKWIKLINNSFPVSSWVMAPVLKYNNIILLCCSATVFVSSIKPVCSPISMLTIESSSLCSIIEILHYEEGDPWHLHFLVVCLSVTDGSIAAWGVPDVGDTFCAWCLKWRVTVSSRCKETWPLTRSSSILGCCQWSDKRCRHLPQRVCVCVCLCVSRGATLWMSTRYWEHQFFLWVCISVPLYWEDCLQPYLLQPAHN